MTIRCRAAVSALTAADPAWRSAIKSLALMDYRPMRQLRLAFRSSRKKATPYWDLLG
jgi:hypothetical protein